MKKFLLIVLMIALSLSLFLSGGAAFASAEEEVTPYTLASAFVQNHSKRDILSGGEEAAAATLKNLLTEDGYAVTTPECKELLENENGGKVTYSYSHVLGYKDNGKDKTLLFGCYYGGFEPTDAAGVGEGASVGLSVGAMLYLAKELVAASCAYNIGIAFWGGISISGSFDVKELGIDLDKIALYVNLDNVAAGDHDYLYADDVPRTQETFFRRIISDEGADILSAPVYKRSNSLSYSSNERYAFTHLGLLGVNRFFLDEDVPCVSFVGGAWDYDCGMYRYEGKGEIEGTSLDTVEEINRLNGGEEQTKKRLLAVTGVVLRGVQSEDLPDVLDKAGREVSGASLASPLAYYLITLIGLALVFVFFLLLFLMQGKDRRETVWKSAFDAKEDPYEEFRSDESNGQEDPFEGQDREEPSQQGGEDDDDDIFRF